MDGSICCLKQLKEEKAGRFDLIIVCGSCQPKHAITNRDLISYMCKCRFLMAKHLPCGVWEYKDSNTRHSLHTAAIPDANKSTMYSFEAAHLISIFWFSSESKQPRRKNTFSNRDSSSMNLIIHCRQFESI